MMWYNVTVETAEGQGDYGSNHRTITYGKSSTAAMVSAVRELENAGHHVLVFRGKDLGILQYETGQAQQVGG